MNREIIFRGKREKTGEWVEGYLVKRDEPFLHDIVIPIGNTSSMTYAIIRETVGQYTGLNDCKGNRIFEGDVLVGYNTYNFKVCIENGHAFIKWVDDGERLSEYLGHIYIKENDVEIIGNIWDNPELLVAE